MNFYHKRSQRLGENLAQTKDPVAGWPALHLAVAGEMKRSERSVRQRRRDRLEGGSKEDRSD